MHVYLFLQKKLSDEKKKLKFIIAQQPEKEDSATTKKQFFFNRGQHKELIKMFQYLQICIEKCIHILNIYLEFLLIVNFIINYEIRKFEPRSPLLQEEKM